MSGSVRRRIARGAPEFVLLVRLWGWGPVSFSAYSFLTCFTSYLVHINTHTHTHTHTHYTRTLRNTWKTLRSTHEHTHTHTHTHYTRASVACCSEKYHSNHDETVATLSSPECGLTHAHIQQTVDENDACSQWGCPKYHASLLVWGCVLDYVIKFSSLILDHRVSHLLYAICLIYY